MGPGIIRLLRPKTGGAHALRAAWLAVLAAAALVPHPASAQSRTAVANQSAIVLTAGSIVKLTDMTFGNIIPSGGGGTVVLTPSASATCTTPATLVHSGACTAATFAIRGKRNQRVRIRDLGATVTLSGPGGATMTMDTITSSVTGMTATGNGQGWNFGNWLITDPSGNAGFSVGGTLHVAANQAVGVYNGTLTIQIQFN
jgi:hypothetical protein